MVRHRVFAGVERTCWTGAAPRWLRVALLALATLLPAVDALVEGGIFKGEIA